MQDRYQFVGGGFGRVDVINVDLWIRALGDHYVCLCPVCGVGRSDSWSPCGHDNIAITKCAA